MSALNSIPSPDDWKVLRLKRSTGADVAAWQTVLISYGAVFTKDIPGIFGEETHNSTMSFQLKHGIDADGIVGPVTRARIDMPVSSSIVNPVIDFKNIPYIEATNWSRNKPARKAVKWIVIHCMEGSETETRAERCAKRLASGENAPRASAHYCIDSDSIVRCVPEDRVAWHAPGANRWGIGIEHAGFARQIPEQWLDTFGRAMLGLSAQLSSQICFRWNIPIEHVDVQGLKRGDRGITTHAEVSKAFGKSTHWDPGPGFPMDWYIERIRKSG